MRGCSIPLYICGCRWCWSWFHYILVCLQVMLECAGLFHCTVYLWNGLQVMLECAGLFQPLFVVSGSCQGIEISLDSEALPFGAVVQKSSSSRKLMMLNTGDIGARFKWDHRLLRAGLHHPADRGLHLAWDGGAVRGDVPPARDQPGHPLPGTGRVHEQGFGVHSHPAKTMWGSIHLCESDVCLKLRVTQPLVSNISHASKVARYWERSELYSRTSWNMNYDSNLTDHLFPRTWSVRSRVLVRCCWPDRDVYRRRAGPRDRSLHDQRQARREEKGNVAA